MICPTAELLPSDEVDQHPLHRSPPGQRWAGSTLLLSLTFCWTAALAAQDTPEHVAEPVVGPSSGTLLVAGGGPLGPEIWKRFVELAGGPEARIVVIPTAAADDEFPEGGSDGLEALEAAGATRLVVLHTRDPHEANSETFAGPLQNATGVWIPGGRQHRLVDSYLHTRVHEALREVLERGGVVGGTSAGASIMASFLVRGDPETNQVVMSPEYAEGFGFLDHVAVDQHLLARNREQDLWEILALHPDLLGIGLDEGTALVIRGNRAEVIGRSSVLMYDASGPIPETRVLHGGDVFDLGLRSPLTQGALGEADDGGAGTSH